MSFNQTINETINSIIFKYNKTIAEKFNLNSKDLDAVWTGKEGVM